MDPEQSRVPAQCPPELATAIGTVQLILAEKRTALAAMRTGIAILALPLSIISLLIATSHYYALTDVMNVLVPVLLILVALIILGGYLVSRSIIRMHRYEAIIGQIKSKHRDLADYIV